VGAPERAGAWCQCGGASRLRFGVVALAVILAPTVALLVGRRRIGTPNTAAALVIWGALAATGEHGTWAMRLAWHERDWLNPHSAGHYFMAGVYAAVAGVLLGVIAVTLLRERRRSGWFAVLFALLSVLLWIMHRGNIARLLRGTEDKIGASTGASRSD